MAEMVGSAVVQEVVSGAFSFMRNSHEEMAAQSHLIERLEWAHWNLALALQRTKRMPIMEVPLLKLRRMIKHAFEESRDLLDKQHTQLVNLEDEGAQEGVTLSVSLPNRIMHAVKPFFGTEKGSISGSCVKRFEWFAEMTDRFVRDVESGFSLARYRFSYPLITQLLQEKYLFYRVVSGRKARWLSMFPSFLEDYGVVVIVLFNIQDLETPMKCFNLALILRLSESTDIVGIFTKYLQSLEPKFKSVADFASGELTQISTQVGVFEPEPAQRECLFNMATNASKQFRPEPLCCIGDGFQPSAKNMLSSELRERLPEKVSYLWFDCFISAADYNLPNSTNETDRNTINDWPTLQLSVAIQPHSSLKIKDDKVGAYLMTSSGGYYGGPLDCVDFSKMAMAVSGLAVYCFKINPEQTEFQMLWYSPHGHAIFTVSKPTIEIGCAPKTGDGSKTRRLSKRKR